jgi:hypothetical protein
VRGSPLFRLSSSSISCLHFLGSHFILRHSSAWPAQSTHSSSSCHSDHFRLQRILERFSTGSALFCSAMCVHELRIRQVAQSSLPFNLLHSPLSSGPLAAVCNKCRLIHARFEWEMRTNCKATTLSFSKDDRPHCLCEWCLKKLTNQPQ